VRKTGHWSRCFGPDVFWTIEYAAAWTVIGLWMLGRLLMRQPASPTDRATRHIREGLARSSTNFGALPCPLKRNVFCGLLASLDICLTTSVNS